MLKIKILTLFVLFVANALFAQVNVSKVGTNFKTQGKGVFYSLPQTVIQVDLILKKIQKIKGPYAEYADQLLGLSQVTTNNSTEYELRDIRLSAYNEPDPSQYYFIQKPKHKKDREAIELFLSGEGVLTGIGEAGDKNSNRRQNKDLTKSEVDIPELASPNVFERMDTVVKRISLDTTIIEQKFFRKTSATKSVEQKARETADFILKLDESMYNLINGYQEVNYEKGTMEFMFNQMKSMKLDYLELFKGITNVSEETYTFYFVPLASDEPEPLCRYSLSKGIGSKTTSAGDLVQIQASGLNKTSVLKTETDRMSQKSLTERGIYYRIPEKASVLVKIGGQVKLETQFLINQLGIVSFLPASSIRNISLDTQTGTLRRVVFE